jgi:Protein of unknown function (DUF2911)
MIRAKHWIAAGIFLFSYTLEAQEAAPERISPASFATLRYKDTYAKITYSQPRKRGREIFGSLVPYGQVWRTGANEATEITLTKDVFINGMLITAGTYSLFTIPDKDKWIVILNKELGLWGSYNYNYKNDLLRFEVPVQADTIFTEAFTIRFDQRNNVADLLLFWDKTKISIPIQCIEPRQ